MLVFIYHTNIHTHKMHVADKTMVIWFVCVCVWYALALCSILVESHLNGQRFAIYC